jgi:hypothetical protein
MMKLKDKMTPAELADCLGLARQTINRWVREQKWRTETIPGVKGGRARLIIIDKPVLDFLANIPALRHLLTEHQLAEPSSHYFVNDAGAIWRQIAETLHLMTMKSSSACGTFSPVKESAGSCRVSVLPVRNR